MKFIEISKEELENMYFESAHGAYFNGWNDAIDEVINQGNQPTVEAIPTAWIVAQIQQTSGAESSYYARLLHKWREENGIIS